MNPSRIERPHYFAGEALLTEDFRCEQQYQMDMLAARNASLYLYGISRGLEVTLPLLAAGDQASQLEVTPGMAIDSLGRQIILVAPAVVPLDALDAGITYFITINYHEVYADLSDASGTAGYKRIVQQPQIQCLRNLDQPGLFILLAVVSLTTQRTIGKLTYQSARYERRYVGTSVGSVNFITEGSGVGRDLPNTPTNVERAGMLAKYANISARRDGAAASDYYLEFDTPRSRFLGALSTRHNLGIGIDEPLANLQIDAVTFKGNGTMSWNNLEVSFAAAPMPFLQPGDQLSADASLAHGPAQVRTVRKADPLSARVWIDKPFTPLSVDPADGWGYTYRRSALARFSLAPDTSVLQVNLDGSVGLGLQAALGAGGAGPHALQIDASRNVGIGMNQGKPRAALDVSGQIMADSVVASGAVKAQSFEGNGSKLKGMAMLSYWTKEDPNTSASRLFYNSGNVGVLDTNPVASLSVGGGAARIGAGVITAVAGNAITGYNTRFKTQVSVGDTIAIGTLIQQSATLAADPSSDEALTLLTQFEIPVSDSPYSYRSLATNVETVGQGKVSSNGTAIIGKGTKFSSMAAGDVLLIPRFTPAADCQTHTVADDKTDTKLVLRAPVNEDSATFTAATSAYMVSSGLLGQFRANEANGLLPPAAAAPPPPALLIAYNGETAVPNTVGINVERGDLIRGYALQVNGPVDIQGGSVNMQNLTVQTLWSTTSLAVGGSGFADPPTLLSVAAPGNGAPLLSVAPNSVQVGSGAGNTTLKVNGDIDASGALQAAALAGSIIGVPVLGQLDSTGQYSAVASSDGMVIATLGTIGADPTNWPVYAGVLLGKAGVPGKAQRATQVTTFTVPTLVSSSKKGGDVYFNFPIVSTLNMPVRSGELWSLQLINSYASIWPVAPLVFYWVPLGAAPSASDTVDQGGPAPDNPADAMVAATDALQAYFNAHPVASMTANAQRIIDERVSDLVQVFGDATHMNPDPHERARFIGALHKIVCSPALPGQASDNAVEPADIEALIDIFGHACARQFSAGERQLLAAGVEALVQINASEANRGDLVLIKNNIDMFIDNAQTVLGGTLSAGDKRRLTRALMRLVGDGRQSPP